MNKIRRSVILIALSTLAGCATKDITQAPETTSITIFSINDFHGNIQSEQPVPYLLTKPDITNPGKTVQVPAGGYAYLATKLKERRAAVGPSILVGAGDLMGASPMGSALLKDEPVVEALNRLDLSVTAVGNHEFDAGTADLMRRINGACPVNGCAYADFHGAKYAYLGANIHESGSSQPWLPPYAIRQIGDIKIGFIGAVTADVPNLVAGDAVKQLRFEDEATAINRYVPELQKQGVNTIVVLIHEGAVYKGPENDPSYRCEGLQGPIIDITKKLDKAISLVISGHSHQGYTCKIDGRLVVQGRSYGAFLTESTLTIDRKTGQVIDTKAVNHLIDQQSILPDAQALLLVNQVAKQTAAMRQRPVMTLTKPLLRFSEKDHFDSALGNMIADAQLHLAEHLGTADMAFMNEGGIRSDLPSGAQKQPVEVSFGDIYAVQPFGNGIVRMQLTGAQIIEVLQQQWHGRPAGEIKKLYVSKGFSYEWNRDTPSDQAITHVELNGKPLDLNHSYSVIVNSFLADGGDGFTVFKQATERQLVGRDLDAMESYMREQGGRINEISVNRVKATGR